MFIVKVQVCQKFKVFQSLSFNRCFLVGDLSMTETRSLSYTFIYTEFFKKFQVFPKVKFVQSLSFSKVNFFPKFKFVQSSSLSKVQVFPKFKFVQSFSSFKIMDFLKCSRASQWHCVPGCILCKRVSPKRNAPKNILKNPLFKVHYGFTCLSKVRIVQNSSFFQC